MTKFEEDITVEKTRQETNETLLDAETRAKLAGRVDVLDKVKDLFLLPELDMMTVPQVADYYEVDYEAIKKCYQRNKNEIDSDGTEIKPLSFWKGHFVPAKNSVRGSMTFRIDDTTTVTVPNAGIRLFSKRAILRIGMLLRDSEVAKEVRTQLLNTFGHASDEQRTEDIDAEQDLYMAFTHAVFDGSTEDMLVAAKNIFDFKNRHIKQLEESNRILAADTLTWTDRASVNRAIRIMALMANMPFSTMWQELYTELRYKYGICLSQRGKAPYIQHVKEKEWPKVQRTLSAICVKYGVDIHKVAEMSKLQGMEQEQTMLWGPEAQSLLITPIGEI